MTQIVDEFASGYGFSFDSFQTEACQHVADGRGVLVAAPTGSGKTVVGEFACWLALREGRKCFYTTPIKALSNQKYHDLVAKHGAENVGLLTGEISINGDADIVVMTTEVLRNMLYARSRTLEGLGYVVMDEVHYLADRFRGAVWEEVILGLAPEVSLVALSATVSNAEEFGAWLDEVRDDVAVVVWEKRPVTLQQHILVKADLYDLYAGGSNEVNPQLLKIEKEEASRVRDDARRPRGRSGKGKRDVAYGSGRFGGGASRQWTDRRSSGEQKAKLTPSRSQTVRALARANLLPAIVFVFSRSGCDAAVRQLLGTDIILTSIQERDELLHIAAEHATSLSDDDKRALGWDTFVAALSRGIAAHHAGMLPAFKAIVEEGFTRGLIKVVFATETLALGINMPARTVVIEKLVKYNGEAHVDITPGEYTQLTGRAGRRGIDSQGHAVVAWQPGMEPRAVAGLASRRTYPLRSSFAPNYNMAVNLVGTVGREHARRLLEQSFAQFQTDRRIVAMARNAQYDVDRVNELWEQASCEMGDFREYAQMREQVSQLEAEAARLNKQDKRADTIDSLLRLEPGDLAWVPNGKHKGWATVITTGQRPFPNPLVMTETHQIVQLAEKDFNEPTRVISKVRVPKKFDRHSAADRKTLAKAMDARLEIVDTDIAPIDPARRSDELEAEIMLLRSQLRSHPCHACPDRETHARAAEQAIRLEREHSQARAKVQARTNSIANQFDRICAVLDSLGYLDGDQVTDDGQTLKRIYNDMDLVVTESIRQGVFDELTTPQLAAVLSTLVYEARATGAGVMHRMPDRGSEAAQSRVREIWRDIGLVERDARVERTSAPQIGFAEAAYGWASGLGLAEVLAECELPAGDFVRWTRQVIDLAAQIAVAPGAERLHESCRDVVRAMRRDIVDFNASE